MGTDREQSMYALALHQGKPSPLPLSYLIHGQPYIDLAKCLVRVAEIFPQLPKSSFNNWQLKIVPILRMQKKL